MCIENQIQSSLNLDNSTFTFEGETYSIKHDPQNSGEVLPDVWCDVYDLGDPNIDIAVVIMQPGTHTPPQVLEQGERTIEMYLAGKGRVLQITPDAQVIIDMIDFTKTGQTVELKIGQLIQIQADPDSLLQFIEICVKPKFSDGRYIEPDSQNRRLNITSDRGQKTAES